MRTGRVIPRILVIAATAIGLALVGQLAYAYTGTANVTFTWATGNAKGWTSSGVNTLDAMTPGTSFVSKTGNNFTHYFNADFAAASDYGAGTADDCLTPLPDYETIQIRKYGCRQTDVESAFPSVFNSAAAADSGPGAEATGTLTVTDTTLTGTLTVGSTTNEPTGATITPAAGSVRLSNSVGDGTNGFNMRLSDGSPFGNAWYGVTTSAILTVNLTGTFSASSWTITGGTVAFSDPGFACQQGGFGGDSRGILCTPSTTGGGFQADGDHLDWGMDTNGSTAGGGPGPIEVRDATGTSVVASLPGVYAAGSVDLSNNVTVTGEFRSALGSTGGGCPANIRWDGTKISCGQLVAGDLTIIGQVTGGPTVSATPSTPNPGVGSSFTVALSGSNLVNVGGATVILTFDASKVSFASPLSGNICPSCRPASGPMSAGAGSFVVVSGSNPRTLDLLPGSPPVNGNPDLAVFTFNAIAPGNAGIVFSDDGGIASGWFDNDTFEAIPVTYNQPNVTVIVASDTTPDAFAFTDQTDVAVSTPITSAPITVAGIDALTAVSVSGAAGSEYSINAGAFTSTVGNVSNGDSVAVRHTSSASFSTATDSVLNIGGVTDTFTSTTLAAPPDTTPDAFAFSDQTGVAISTPITSAPITVAGINAPAAISVSGAASSEYSINAGAFSNAAGTVSNGDSVAVRHTSSASFSTAISSTLTVGGVSDVFTSTTAANSPSPGALTLLTENYRSTSGALGFQAFKTCAPAAGNGCYNPGNAWVIANGVTGSDATWDWNGATGTLTATGTFWTTSFISSNPSGSSVISDKTVNLTINTVAQTTTAASYNCVEGNFLAAVGANGCLNTLLGGNFVDDSTVLYNVSSTANCVQRTIGGDDTSNGDPRGLFTAGAVGACDPVVGGYGLYTVVSDATATGGNLVLSNGIALGTCLTFGCAAELASAGAHWLTFAPGAPGDSTPSAFVFTDQPNVPVNTVRTSNAAAILGITAPATVTVTGGTYSIGCTATFVSSSGTVNNGQSICVRHTSSASLSTPTDTVLTVGGVSDTFTSTTVNGTTPDQFTFTDQTGVPWNTFVYAAPVTITGLGLPVLVQVNGSGGSGASIGCTGTYVNGDLGGNISNGQTICVRHQSADTDLTTLGTTVTIGGVSDTFNSTTGDTTPTAFSFTDQTGVPLLTLIESAPVTITGLTLPAFISVSGGVYSIGCTGTYIAITTVVLNNDTVCVRHTSAATGGVSVGTVLTIGGVSDTFTSTTISDTVPNAFTFTPQTGVPVSSVRTSAAVTITGINTAASVSVSGGSYSKNEAGYTSSAGSISNGDSVTLRHTSAATDGVAVNTTLTVGGVSGTFTSTTYAVTNLAGVAGGAAYYDPVLDITWLANANLAATNDFGVTGINANGSMSWAKANEWIAAMNSVSYLGVSSWRLPVVTDTGAPGCDFDYTATDCGYNLDLTSGEMARLFYSTLGNTGYYDTGGGETGCSGVWPFCLTNTGPFSNLQTDYYWSGTTYALDTSHAWHFLFSTGAQTPLPKSNAFYAWPVVVGNPLSVQALAPAIGSVSPNPVTGSMSPQTITINGTNFVNKPTVTLTWTGQLGYVVPTGQVTYVSSTQLQISVTTGTNADNWTARVTNPDGQSSNTANFSVGQPQAPQVSGVVPNPVTASASPRTITINGVYFVNTPTLTLTWPGQPGYTVPSEQVTYLSSNQLQLSISPATAGSWTVQVTNPDAQLSNTVGFTVVQPATPAITGVFPDPVTGSASPQTITIYGTNFASSPTLTLTSAAQPGGFTVPAGQVIFLSSTELRMSITTGIAADASWTVRATNPDSQLSNTFGFEVVEPDATSGTVPMYEIKPDLSKLRLYYLNVTTGGRTAVISEVDTGPNPIDLKFGKSFTGWPFPDDTFAYVVNSGDATISTFVVNPTDGALTLATSAATGAGPVCVTLDSGGGVANVINGDGTISGYSVNPDTGALIPEGLFVPPTPAACPLTTTQATGLATPYVGNPFLFVLNPGYQQFGWKDSISVFGINAVNGALTAVPGSPFRISTNQSQRLRSSAAPSGTFIYVLGGADSATAVIGLNPLTGALTEVPGSPFPIAQGVPGGVPTDTTLDPGGVFQYVINGDSTILGYRIDPRTGQFLSLGTLIGAPPGNPALTSAAIDPGGNRLYVTDDDVNGNPNGVVRAYQINRNSGGLTLIGTTVDAGEHPVFVTVHPSGRFAYVVNQLEIDDSGAIATFSIAVATGALSPVGSPVPTGRYPTAPLTVHPNGRFAYTTNDFDGTLSAFRVDSLTGGLTPIEGSPFSAGGSEPHTVTIASNGRFAYVANAGSPGTISAFRIDPASGALTPVAGSPFPSDYQLAPSTGPRAVIFTPQ